MSFSTLLRVRDFLVGCAETRQDVAHIPAHSRHAHRCPFWIGCRSNTERYAISPEAFGRIGRSP